MSAVEISERMASLADTHTECMSLISRLTKLPGGTGSDGARAELATLIHQTLSEAESSLELLTEQVRDAPGASAALSSKLSKLSEDLRIARRQYRKAQLEAKRNSDAAWKAEREALLGNVAARKPGAKAGDGVPKDELELAMSSDVTAALRRTQDMMAVELAKSRFASETLAESTAALKELGGRYSAFDEVISRSKVLIRDLVRRNKSDRWYYETAVKILLGTLLWLVVRRLLYGPMWLLFGLPVKVVWWGIGLVFGMMPDMGPTGMGEAVSPSVPVRSEGSMSREVAAATVAPAPTGVIERDEEDSGGEPSILDEVGRIIDGETVGMMDGEETVIARNPKSRRFEYDAAEDAAHQPTGETAIGVETEEAEMAHDEL